MVPPARKSRRRFLQIAGVASVSGLAGCGDGGDGEEGLGEDGTESPANGENGTDGQDGQDLGPVPGEYETATSLDGTERNPDGLSNKDAVEYQSSPNDSQQCSGCALYIEDMNGDGLGACAIVEGMIEPEGWCVSYVEYEG